MTYLSRERFSRPPGNSSRGTQVDLDAIETNSDDDDGAPTAQRGIYG